MTDPMEPLVTVIVAAHNAEDTLAEALRSALGQTHANLELIVVDDGSSDSTADIAGRFALEDSRVQLHRRRQGGVSAALNSALSLSTGTYVARLDADDVWHTSKLSKQVALAEARPEVGLVYCFVRYIDANGRVLFDAEPQHFPERALARGLYESLVGGNSATLFRRSAVIEAGGYDERLSSWEDLMLQLSISERHPIACVPEYLVGYRVRPGSLSANPRNMLDSWRAARSRIETAFPQVPRQVHRWAHGKRCAMLAESFAWRGRYRTAAALLLQAFRYDPNWTTHFLAYRAGRKLRRLLLRRTAAGSSPLFEDCRPDENVAPLRNEIGVSGGGLRRLEEERARRLTAIDEKIAEAATPLPRPGADGGNCPPAPGGP